jgi:hypothetical protein
MPGSKACLLTSRRECIGSRRGVDGVIWRLEKYNSGLAYRPALWERVRRDPIHRDQLWFGVCAETSHSSPRFASYDDYVRLFNYTATAEVGGAFHFFEGPSGQGCAKISDQSRSHLPVNDQYLQSACTRWDAQLEQPLSELMAHKRMGGHIMYLATNCDCPSDRDSFVKALQSYLDVDSFGGCLHNKNTPPHIRALEIDPKTGRSTRESWGNYAPAQRALLRQYRFRIVIPNTLCTDYVTEKFFECLKYGVIPIYLGSPGTARDWDPGNLRFLADYIPAASSLRHLYPFQTPLFAVSCSS